MRASQPPASSTSPNVSAQTSRSSETLWLDDVDEGALHSVDGDDDDADGWEAASLCEEDWLAALASSEEDWLEALLAGAVPSSLPTAAPILPLPGPLNYSSSPVMVCESYQTS